ncbi:helix-turn-helix domain-containing protein [Tenacibaculum piscium]|uniref:AlbA family DNA-binding domain-containing protein n=1 Tax=Tenacibaculum piscium TaxID=1458515 RepID=UPI001F2F5A4E|nr:ATP-binding protein [Tenacibaculum piscium]
MNYNPFNKKDVSELSIEDIKTLIENEIGEGWYIEYKREVPKLKGGKLDNIKIAKSISSFANTKGGWIFWGIDSDDKNKPTTINGFDISTYRNFEDQISQIINANISPKPYYHFKKINLENGNIILVIKVDESPTPPYITSQGIIYQRENNESKPIKDRYIIEKLNEKTNNYFEAIERFSTFDLQETKGQSEWNQTYLELYLFPTPFDNFTFKEFYTSEFFKKVSLRFYQNVDINKADSIIPLNLGFNSIYSSEGSLIIRPLKEENLIYKSTTVELFENGNLKFLIPLYEFDSRNIPERFENSDTLNYLLDKYSPNETVEQTSFNTFGMPPINKDLPPITRRKETDFVNHIKFIDGMELILNILIIVSKYKAVLDDNEFDFETKIGFRAKITDCWRKFVFFDNDDYLEKLKIYNIPLSPKSEIEIPDFKNGNAYSTKISEEGAYFKIAKFILEGIGLPDSQTIDFSEIIKKGLERFEVKNGS